ncbi:MAG: hypothetical protein A2474_04045 [Elusimicrobia bacterium RIFOXYC2_FULL_34_12]|nr:MAG: hypothetical protein A2474_04045 [Elusimicrobia bacterium RIFOXYC2_FULL_34_12]
MFNKIRKIIEPVISNTTKPLKIDQYVVIGYPEENEKINHPNYAIKIGTNCEGNVDISIDGGDWNRCRHSGGFWWFDWTNYPQGEHKLVARLCDNEGKVLTKSVTRKCKS